VRELRNVLERAALLSRDATIDAGDLRFLGAPGGDEPPAAAGAALDTHFTLEEVERRHIAAVLAEEDGRVEAAARRLGVPRSSLYKRVRALGLIGPKP
jgi:DNA-binding NtrC family response regulator